jgi:hypothetical protein
VPDISIQGTTISIPNSGSSPNWSPAVIEAFQAIAEALASVTGDFDVSPRTQTIDSLNPGTVVIDSLSFPTSEVRSVIIRYSVFRTASSPSTTAYEAGTLTMVYSPNNPTNSKWEVQREAVGDGKCTFSVSDTGDVSITTTQIGTTNHTGTLSFAASTLPQSS